jgi:hypothetical protein
LFVMMIGSPDSCHSCRTCRVFVKVHDEVDCLSDWIIGNLVDALITNLKKREKVVIKTIICFKYPNIVSFKNFFQKSKTHSAEIRFTFSMGNVYAVLLRFIIRALIEFSN